ncbi:trypsin-like serine protease [Candidatus Dojkabacteria bacterium]|uniref:Trypsin-like serine protease n=1 Tax=Candidatus Dojkabacteria bacterium TaxID=2099670 RepID=A0A847ETI9_9BACT|nr:trypsin-like serine protease [Candidatus Dojkabacteria bacterium]
MEEKKNVEEIKEVKKGKKVKEMIKPVVKKALSSRYLKIFGFSLMFLGVLICILLALILLIKYYQMEEEGLINNESNSKPSITITQEEDVVIKVVKNSSPSVVSIAVSQVTLRRGEGLVDEVSNIGTGFIVDPSGIIVTNQHVVSDISATYKVITSDGKEYEIVEIVRDDGNDIAILKIDATQLPALELGDSDTLVVGQTVIAIGTPLGEYAGSVTTGVISGTNRSVTTSSGWFGSTTKTYENVLQTDAAVNSGNSGGPLISTEGKVVGINFATTANADNISFALPINTVKQRLEEYRVYGKFIKPYVGISYQMISEYQAIYYTDVVAGALVMNIDLEGPASKVDIKRGDIIVKVNEEVVEDSFAYIVQSYKVGDEITLEIWREGKTHTVKVILVEAD